MKTKTTFITTVKEFYQKHHRPMPWREEPTPYYVLVLELMLQQTQVQRVMTKFPPFIETRIQVTNSTFYKLADPDNRAFPAHG